MAALSDQPFLITGAHGFIGAWIVKRLLAANAEVVIFDRADDPRRLRLIMHDGEIARARFVKGDITARRCRELSSSSQLTA
jgi:nucleoside-diphosphate-sugar epimerase